MQRNLTGLSADDKAELIRSPDEQVSKMQEAVSANLAFLGKLTALIQAAQTSMAGDGLDKLREAGCPSTKTVEKTLWHFVREWSKEGEDERGECFQRLLGALEGHLASDRETAASSGAKPPRVLCPGAQLGRLPFEVQSRGFECEACEARALLYFGSQFIRESCSTSEGHCIQPFVLGTCNRIKATDNVRSIPIPEVAVPSEALPPIRFGEFTRLYDSAPARASFDAVLTNFSLDTTGNIFRYVRTVAFVTRPGGLWANFGPLAFDQSHDEAHGQGVEVSWEELKFAISHFFEIKEEAFVDSVYAENARAMMQFQYSCVYFSAIRNDKPALGIGEASTAAAS